MTTIICDIDGTLCRHNDNQFSSMQLLPGTREKLIEWQKKGYNLILITGRRESTRLVTEEQLERAGIAYDQLIMGVGPGPRYLINDMKPGSLEETAIAINLIRDDGYKGISKVEI